MASGAPFGDETTGLLARGERGELEEEERETERLGSSFGASGFSLATDESLELSLELVDETRSRRRLLLLWRVRECDRERRRLFRSRWRLGSRERRRRLRCDGVLCPRRDDVDLLLFDLAFDLDLESGCDWERERERDLLRERERLDARGVLRSRCRRLELLLCFAALALAACRDLAAAAAITTGCCHTDSPVERFE